MRNTELPRLKRAVQWTALLSDNEAAHCIERYRAGDEWAGEAVNNFGGTKQVVGRAFKLRHIIARLGTLDAARRVR